MEGRVGIPSRAALADWTVLLLAPLPFSPWLEPYHAIPLLPGAILCVIIVLDERAAAKDRIIALAALLALALVAFVITPFPLRGLRLAGATARIDRRARAAASAVATRCKRSPHSRRRKFSKHLPCCAYRGHVSNPIHGRLSPHLFNVNLNQTTSFNRD